MSNNQSYAERLKRMKKSVAKNKDILDGHFPDDVTTTGSPDLIQDDENAADILDEEASDEKEGSKKPK
jgi:hypothetical protein